MEDSIRRQKPLRRRRVINPFTPPSISRPSFFNLSVLLWVSEGDFCPHFADSRAHLAFRRFYPVARCKNRLASSKLANPNRLNNFALYSFQPTVTNLALVEAHLDHRKGVLNLGTQLRLAVFNLAFADEAIDTAPWHARRQARSVLVVPDSSSAFQRMSLALQTIV